MKIEIKDKMLKIGFICVMLVIVLGVGLSAHKCYHKTSDKTWYGEKK